MSRKNARPEWHEPVTAVVVEIDDPIEDTIEVGTVVLVDGPIDPVPLGASAGSPEDYTPVRHSAGPMPDLPKPEAAASAVKDTVKDAAENAGEAVKDVAQKAQDKAQDAVSAVQDKAQDIAQTVTDEAQDVGQKAAEGVASAKDAAANALESAKSAVPAAQSVAGKISTATTSGAKSAGFGLWLLVQRNPLPALFAISSLVWLFRSNKKTSAQPPVSLTDAAQKVGSVAGHAQVAAGNLKDQVSEQAAHGAGWFSRTLQENPLAIGAMAIVFGAGLGFAVPETPYEDKLLGKTRDQLADKAQAAAQDLTQKVSTVAQSVVHEAVETAKAEAKNQGLTGEADPAPQGQSQEQTQS